MIAMAMPGPFDYKNGISWIKGLNKYEAIYGLNIKQYLATELNIAMENILFRNDAEAFLHGEVVAGAGLGFEKIIGITLGTGLGSAKSSDGVTVDVNRGSSRFGQSIADDYMTTRWFVKRYAELTGKTLANVKELALIANTDADAQLVFKEFTSNLVLFLKDFINDEEPDLLIIGGNIAKAAKLFLPSLQFQLAQYFDYMDIKIAELGEDSSIMGAAASFEDVQQPSN
jgi:glucokinase